MTLLIAEDNPRMRQLIRSLCAKPEDQVIECASGWETIRAYQRHRPDWVLLDLTMPGLDGFETMKSILEISPNARIVVVSERPESDYGAQARTSGAVDYVNKENLLRLPEILNRASGRKRGNGGSPRDGPGGV